MRMRRRMLLGVSLTVGAMLAGGATALATTSGGSAAKSTAPAGQALVSYLNSAHLAHSGAARPAANQLPARSVRSAAAVKTRTAKASTLAVPAPVTLPFATPDTMIVDATDGYLFFRAPTGIVVTDASGAVVTTLEGADSITEMTLDEPDHVLYARIGASIAVIDTSALTETKRLALGSNDPYLTLGYSAGTVWFGVAGSDLVSIDVATGTVTSHPVAGAYIQHAQSVPGHPGLLLAYDGLHAQNELIDVSGASPTLGATLSSSDSAALTPDGNHLTVDGNLYTVPSLSPSGSLGGGSISFKQSALSDTAVADASEYMYTEYPNIPPNVEITSFGVTAPKRTYVIPQNFWEAAFSPDGDTLYLEGSPAEAAGNATLTILTGVSTAVSSITATMPHNSGVGKAATVSGTLSFQGQGYDAKARTLHVARTDRSGTHALPDVTTDTSGKFTVSDPATPMGRADYKITFDGDADNAGTTGGTYTLREIPWDVNGDGYADLVVGSPGEDIGSIVNAGDVTVMYGHAAGVTGVGSKEYDQNTAGVPGTAEAGDQFGWSQATGDFNDDGYPDVAVSANAEDSGAAVNAGGVWVFFGSASGLRTDNVETISMNDVWGSETKALSNAYLGEAMTVGDFNGDGISDLAIGAAGINHAFLVFGSQTGLDKTVIGGLQPGSAGVPEVYSSFGFSLAAADINGDGFTDLAIGSPFDYPNNSYSTGSVEVIYGNARISRVVSGSQKYDESSSGVPGSEHSFSSDLSDEFGWQVALADVNGDHKADLAVSAPGVPVTYGGSSHQDAGTVTMLYASGSKISTTGALLVSQATTGMPGSPGKGDQMGNTMVSGDSNGDGKADLAIFSPGDGYVTVVKGAGAGASFATAVGWTQNSAGIPGTSESGDFWGDSLRFENVKGGLGPQALAVGADGENNGEGAVTIVYSTSSGLTGTGSTAFSQNSTGVPGTAERGDWFGSFLSW